MIIQYCIGYLLVKSNIYEIKVSFLLQEEILYNCVKIVLTTLIQCITQKFLNLNKLRISEKNFCISILKKGNFYLPSYKDLVDICKSEN